MKKFNTELTALVGSNDWFRPAFGKANMFLKLHTADGERIFNMDLVIEIMPLEKGCRLNYGFIFHAYASTDVEERYDEIWESILVGGYL